MAQGIEAIKKSNEAMMASGMKITKFETTTLMVHSCEGNIAEVGTYNMSYTMEGTQGETSDAGKYLTIWKPQADGSLKITFEIWNTDTYPVSGM
jgi:ketosteroid isomerase-like protein